ncbi:Dabb family protein [Pontibacter sp. 172403-2]|uniref:Dabb family protein n=1 Tax=Pontibacter rufus TaxID=2791028 RepID=UPI0018AF5CF1|nr:Dabb family protein [Pontibacter sp. 172403-2]MBF9253452.1 Dabb family protein [Pontibacter sp. 172403-2]
MFVHHVFFWLNNPDATAERSKLLEGLKQLKAIESIHTVHIGVPASTDRPVIEKGYDFSLLLVFNDMEAHDTYQVHPVHKQFVETCAQLWSKVLIYDAVDA